VEALVKRIEPNKAMFVDRYVGSSALFTFVVGWHASAVSLPSGDVIVAQLASPLNDIIFSYIGNN
jgi:hypothetical protein